MAPRVTRFPRAPGLRGQDIIECGAEILASDNLDKAGFAEHVESLAV